MTIVICFCYVRFMKWLSFEHPDISLTVIKNRAVNELVMLLELTLDAFWGSHLQTVFDSDPAYYSAIYRLRKRGLVVSTRCDGKTPQLFLTEKGRENLPAYWYPEHFWDRKWKGNWYLFSYDVPETERAYRNTLREYLKRMRLGKIQKSLWITPNDIRASFDDLNQGASVRDFAVLLQAQTVLGHGDEYLVNKAWPIDRIRKLQKHYCHVYAKNIERVLTQSHQPEFLLQLGREELVAFEAVMTEDPLLPKTLYPEPYYGEQVVNLHRTLGKAIARKLK